MGLLETYGSFRIYFALFFLFLFFIGSVLQIYLSVKKGKVMDGHGVVDHLDCDTKYTTDNIPYTECVPYIKWTDHNNKQHISKFSLDSLLGASNYAKIEHHFSVGQKVSFIYYEHMPDTVYDCCLHTEKSQLFLFGTTAIISLVLMIGMYNIKQTKLGKQIMGVEGIIENVESLFNN